MRLHVQPGNLITFCVGVLFIVIGLYGYHYMGRFLDHARETSGVVVEVVYETGSKKGRIHPVVRYKTADGREITGRSHQHHNVRPGDTVQLVYDTRQPEEIEITTLARAKNRQLLFAVLSVALGLLVCGIGLRTELHR